MGSQETDAFQTLHTVNYAQQARQVWPVRNVLAVAVDDLAQQGDLFYPLVNQCAYLGGDLPNRATALYSSPIWDDAKSTGV